MVWGIFYAMGVVMIKEPGSFSGKTFAVDFGFYPVSWALQGDRFFVEGLDDFDYSVDSIKKDSNVVEGWVYPGPKKRMDVFNDSVLDLPYSCRVFGLPKTHKIKLGGNFLCEDAEFVVWCVSFFVGMRLTTTEAGFLDATPIEPGKLVDFVLSKRGLEESIDLSIDFLSRNYQKSRVRSRVAAVVHALFLAQNPQNLSFERFQYLYMALDACFALVRDTEVGVKGGSPSHAKRIKWMCDVYDIEAPYWASPSDSREDHVSLVRNDAFHEAIFFGRPLGFSLYGGENEDAFRENIPLQMQGLVSRLLVAILGSPSSEYVKTSLDTRQKYELDIK